MSFFLKQQRANTNPYDTNTRTSNDSPQKKKNIIEINNQIVSLEETVYEHNFEETKPLGVIPYKRDKKHLSLISKIALRDQSLQSTLKKPNKPDELRSKSNGRAREYQDYTAYGTLKPHLQLAMLNKTQTSESPKMKSQSFYDPSPTTIEKELDNSLIAKPQNVTIHHELMDNIILRNEHYVQRREKGNNKSFKLPAVTHNQIKEYRNKEEFLDHQRKTYNKFLGTMKDIDPVQIVYNPRSKYKFRIANLDLPNPHAQTQPATLKTLPNNSNSPSPEKTDKIGSLQIATPLTQVKKKLEEESVKNTLKLMKHAFTLEEARQQNRALIEKNKQKLMRNLQVLSKETEESKPRIPAIYPLYNPKENIVDSTYYELSKYMNPEDPNSGTLNYVERKAIEDLSKKIFRDQDAFEDSRGIKKKRELAVSLVQAKAPIYEKNDPKDGPQMTDIRKTGLLWNESDNIVEADRFWVIHLSKDQEVRWDMFEESVRVLIEKKIDTTKIFTREIKWKTFFQFLKDSLTEKATSNETIKEVIESPITKSQGIYSGPIVTRTRWINYTREYGMENALKASLEEFLKSVDEKTYTAKDDEAPPKEDIIPFHLRKNGYSGIYRYACGSWYKGEWQGGKRHGKGKLTLVTGDSYEGDFVNGKRHGTGVQFFTKPIEGVVYRGEWQNDYRHGFGSAEWPDGSFFQVKNARIQVFGTFVWPGEAQYTGYWKGYHMEGEGTYKTKDGEIMTGEWKNSLLNGQGERRTPNGEVYTGTWVDGKLTGPGTMTSPLGKYTGNFVDNQEHGYGSMVWKDGSKYDGKWERGLPHGQGVFTSADGEIYEGQFVDGKKHGKGKKKFKNGDIYEGEWRDDQIDGYGTMVIAGKAYGNMEGGGTYSGTWKNGLRHGQGIMHYENGDVYEGEWANGKKHGQGKLIKVTYNRFGERGEDVYIGQFENDEMHGYGTIHKFNGFYYRGEWFRGKKQGRGESRDENGKFFSGLYHNDEPMGFSFDKIVEKNDDEVKDVVRNLRAQSYI